MPPDGPMWYGFKLGNTPIHADTWHPLGEHYWDILEAMTPEQDKQLEDILTENEEVSSFVDKYKTSLDFIRLSNKDFFKEAVINALLETINDN